MDLTALHCRCDLLNSQLASYSDPHVRYVRICFYPGGAPGAATATDSWVISRSLCAAEYEADAAERVTACVLVAGAGHKSMAAATWSENRREVN